MSDQQVYFGASIARDENDRMIGYHAHRIRRTGKKFSTEGVTIVGPVRPTYQEAAADAVAARDKEGASDGTHDHQGRA